MGLPPRSNSCRDHGRSILVGGERANGLDGDAPVRIDQLGLDELRVRRDLLVLRDPSDRLRAHLGIRIVEELRERRGRRRVLWLLGFLDVLARECIGRAVAKARIGERGDQRGA
jgi:hypothetical protein